MINIYYAREYGLTMFLFHCIHEHFSDGNRRAEEIYHKLIFSTYKILTQFLLILYNIQYTSIAQ